MGIQYEKNSRFVQWIIMVTQLVRAPARKTGDTGSNPGPSKNFSLKLTTQGLSGGYSEKLNFHSVQS